MLRKNINKLNISALYTSYLPYIGYIITIILMDSLSIIVTHFLLIITIWIYLNNYYLYADFFMTIYMYLMDTIMRHSLSNTQFVKIHNLYMAVHIIRNHKNIFINL